MSFLFFDTYRDKLKQAADSEKIKAVLESHDFYFQKAVDKFDEFNKFDASSVDLPQLIEKTKVPKLSFEALLNGYPPESSEYKLLRIIGTLLSYIDEHAAMKQELNEYEDKRSMAATGGYQNNLVCSFLRLKNGEKPETLPEVFRNAIEYIRHPESNVSIFSKKRKKEIMDSIFNGVDGDLFECMKQIGIESLNPMNNGYAYSCILHSPDIRPLWDKKIEDKAKIWSDPIDITESQWAEMLKDHSIFMPNDIDILKKIVSLGGHASCKQLSEKFGGHPTSYISPIVALAKRIKQHTGCKVPRHKEWNDGKEAWWNVPFTGSYTDDNHFDWIMRDELQSAWNSVFGENREPRGYWWLNANPKIWSFNDIEVGHQVDYTSVNENGNRRKVYKNFEDARVGDMVIGYESYPVKAIVSLCRISKAHDGERIWIEKLENLVTPVEYASLLDVPELKNMEYFRTPRGSLFKLTKEEFDELMELIREQNPQITPKKVDEYTKSDFLSEVFFSDEKYEALKNLLLRKKNIILEGAPGVGKTFAAKRLAYSIMGERDEQRIGFVQFHQSYSYEDFIMGYRPDGNGFKLHDGVFYKFCRRADNDPDKPYFFIIDEINRGNLSKIFGELLMLIECDKRGEKMTLTYSETPFSVPKNVYLIGMMNTADRSLAIIDYALRRRFCFFELEPAFTEKSFEDYLLKNGVSEALSQKIIGRMTDLNAEIAKDPNLGKGYRVGHSFFCECKDSSESWYEDIITYEIAPLLREYWFDDPEKAEDFIGRLLR